MPAVIENSPTRPPVLLALVPAVTLPLAELPVTDPAPLALPTKPPASALATVVLTLPLALALLMLLALANEPTRPPVRTPPLTLPLAELPLMAALPLPTRPPAYELPLVVVTSTLAVELLIGPVACPTKPPIQLLALLCTVPVAELPLMAPDPRPIKPPAQPAEPVKVTAALLPVTTVDAAFPTSPPAWLPPLMATGLPPEPTVLELMLPVPPRPTRPPTA